MDNPGEILRLCRLCLVKDQVNIPIFEEQGDIRQTFLKIRSCLPVKVSRDDKLPKKICGGCSNKLDLFYEFWSSTANSEKTLQSWLGQEEEDDKMQEITKPVEALVKEESEALEDGHAHDQSFDEATKDEAEAPPAKRARRTAAVKAQINISHDSDEDEDVDGAEPITKIEDESDDSDGEEKDPSYTEVPGTSADDQAGPSGLGKDGVEAPSDVLTVILQEFKPDDVKPVSVQCPHCTRICKNRRVLKRHLVSHEEARPYSCPICSRAFKRNHEVNNHMKSVHEKNKQFHCNQCPKVFKTKHGFMDHMNRHLKRFVAKCEECQRGFVTRQEFEAHNNKKHNERRETLVCFVCGRTCVDQASLKGHLRTHEDGYHDEKFTCEHCGKKFAQKKGLNHHYIRKHKDGGERYICDLCGKEVNSMRSLKGHKLLHEGLKPLQCPFCTKCFVLDSTLKQHLLTHTGERPHKCDLCGKCFTQRGPLKAHLRMHTGELPYVCGFCSSAFASKAQLNYHVKNKHTKV
ncbi:zinc finger protein OZF-like isoform X41 [Euwallacea similis]|uniref:zinc finger protein OZF-like isoform X41 n=1 Tax=Euwallacea similis TaxID=1736056 RepID=UPI00344BAD0D